MPKTALAPDRKNDLRSTANENCSPYPKPDRPTATGWYWLHERRIDGPATTIIVRVSIHRGVLWGRRSMSFGGGQSVAKFKGDWYGPIPPPVLVQKGDGVDG